MYLFEVCLEFLRVGNGSLSTFWLSYLEEVLVQLLQQVQPDQIHRRTMETAEVHDKSLYVTCEEVCYKMTKCDWVEVTQLRSTQEEADTRVLLHALHATKAWSKAVIVIAEDIDVMVLCLGSNIDIPCSINQKRGTKIHTRFSNFRQLVSSLGDSALSSSPRYRFGTVVMQVPAFLQAAKLRALSMDWHTSTCARYRRAAISRKKNGS